MTERQGFSAEQKERLGRDLDKERVKSRQGRGGKEFSYLEAYDILDRANRIFGFDGWSIETVEMREVWAGKRAFGRERIEKAAVAFTARVRVTVYAGSRVIIKEGWGYGDGDGNDLGEAHELAVKEAESDATKRAFKAFGWQFGLALYDKSQEHVRAGVDDEPVSITQDEMPRRQHSSEVEDEAPPQVKEAPPQKKAAPKKAEGPADEIRQRVAERGAQRAERPDPGAPKVRAFTAPSIPDGASLPRIKEAWREWSQQIAAAIRAAPDEANARATIKTNLKTLAAAGKATGANMIDWANGLIEKRWPPVEAPDEASTELDESNIIPEPTVHTVEEWDAWLDLVKGAIEASPDIASGRDVIRSNKPSFDKASSILEIDVSTWADAKLDKRFGRSRAAAR